MLPRGRIIDAQLGERQTEVQSLKSGGIWIVVRPDPSLQGASITERAETRVMAFQMSTRSRLFLTPNLCWHYSLSKCTRSSIVVSHAQLHRKRRQIYISSFPLAPGGILFCNTLVGIEAVAEVLAVLVRGVVGKHLAARGALEGLEASLALDGLGSNVL
jgi:hypothetical protein